VKKKSSLPVAQPLKGTREAEQYGKNLLSARQGWQKNRFDTRSPNRFAVHSPRVNEASWDSRWERIEASRFYPLRTEEAEERERKRLS